MRAEKTEKQKSDIEKLVDSNISKIKEEMKEKQKAATEQGVHRGWHNLAYELKQGSTQKKRELCMMLDAYRMKMGLFKKERMQLGAAEPEFRDLISKFICSDSLSRKNQDLAEDLVGYEYLSADIDELQRGMLGGFLDLAAQ